MIGAGLAGLTAALRLRQAGRRVTLLTKGIGGIQLGQGTIDVLGRAPGLVDRPIDAIERFVADNPRHPYAAIGAPAVRESLAWLRQTLGEEFVSGDGEHNLYLPTAVGAIRPTLLAPASMLAGRCVDGARFTIVGIRQVKDFHAQLVAENLDRTDLAEIGVPGGGRVHARHATIDFPAREGEVDSTGLNIARALDNPARRADFVARVRSVVPDDGSAIGLPAVLGALDATAWRDIAERLGRPVFEIPLPPPSVPGWRMNERLVQLVKDSRVRLVNGTRVIGCRYEGERLAGVTIKGTGRPVEYTADEFLLAGGGFESGALVLDSFNQLHETILGLPVRGGTIAELVHGDYWGDDQPLFAAGLAVDEQMRVLDADGRVAHPNVRAAGGVLAGAQRWTEKSGDAIALASALKAADSIIAATTGGPVEAPRQARGAEEQARGTDKGDNR